MRATPCPRTISRMRVRATHRRLQHAMGATAEVLAQDAERERAAERGGSATARAAGDGAGSSSSEAGRAHEGDGGDMGCVGVDGKYIGKQQDRSEHARQLSPALPSGA